MNVYIFLHQTIVMFLLLDCIFCNKHGAKHQRAEFKSKDEGYRGRHKIFKTNDDEFAERQARSSFDNRKQCAVMYKNKEPVGLLEPFEDSYRLLPVSGEKIPVDITPIQEKRRNLMDLLYPSKFSEDSDDMSGVQHDKDSISPYSDEKYPYILAKFKIGNKLDKDFSHKRSMHKRSPSSLINDNNVNALKQTLAKMNTENSESIDRELRSILNTMGLIEDEETRKEQEKRSIEEDENMELGSNKINMVKEQPITEKRHKRDDTMEAVDKKDKRQENDTTGPPSAFFNEDSTVETVDLLEGGNEGESEDSNNDKSEEKSREKRETEVKDSSTTQSNSANDDGDLTDYEKRVVRDIRQKIAKLKEEVKKEIEEIKTGGDSADNEITEEKEPQRKKRETKINLLDEENAAIDPLFNAEEEPTPHIRRRRQIQAISDNNDTFSKVETLPNPNSNSDNTYIGRKLMQLQDVKKSRSPRKRLVKSTHKRILLPETYNIRKKRHTRTKRARYKNKEKINTVQRKKRHHKIAFNNSNKVRQENLVESNGMKDTDTAWMKSHDRENLFGSKSVHYMKRQGNINDENVTKSVFKKEIPLKTHRIHKRDLREDYNASKYKDEIKVTNLKILNNLSTVINNPSENYNMHHCCNGEKDGNTCKSSFEKQNFPNTVRKKRSVDDEVTHSDNKIRSGLNSSTSSKQNNNLESTAVVLKRPKRELRQKRDTQEEYEDDAQESDQQNEEENSRMQRSSDVEDEEHFEEQKMKNSFDTQREDYEKKHPCNCQKNSNGCKCGTAEEDSEKTSLNENNDNIAAFDNYDSDYDSKLSKRETDHSNFENGEYYLDLHPDLYQISPSRRASREKRQSFDELLELHGGDATRNHLVAIRQRSMLPSEPHSRFRRRTENGAVEQPQQLTDMSDEDLFGALPQSFEGELTRYKRVKRKPIAAVRVDD